MANPFQSLFDQLPESPIPAAAVSDRPFVFFRDEDSTALAAAAGLGTLGEVLAKECSSSAELFRTLIRLDQQELALRFFAFAVKKRVGMWWAFNCVWEVGLDFERKGALQDADSKSPPPSPEPPPPPDPPAPFDSEGFQEAQDSALASLPEQIAAAHRSLGLADGWAPPPLGDETPSGPLQQLQARFHAAKAATARRPMRILNIVPTSVPPTPGKRERKPAASPELLRLRRKAKMISQDRTMRALACSLQWILHPCQEHAVQAKQAAVSVQDDHPAKHLAKATFWCGEDMNTDSKPKVPPPSNLARKGIVAAVNKALTRKGTTWTRTDRLHRFTGLAATSATGESTWSDQSLTEFEACRRAVITHYKTESE